MLNNKIGIFLPGASGDIAHAMSVLKYKDIMWPGKDIIWFCNLLPQSHLGYPPRTDMLKFNDAISEVRHWPEGFRLSERCIEENLTVAAKGELPWADFSVLMTADNRLNQETKYNFESTKDLDEGYFPAPWLMPNRPPDTHYGDVSRIVYGADNSLPWRPYLCFSDEEREKAKEFRATLPHDKTIMLETFMVSGDVHWTDDMTRNTMRLCREKLGKCNFVFACNKDYSRFFDDPGVVSCSHFTIRQCALIFNHCDLFIGVSSGISIAVSCWGNKPIPRIEWAGSPKISAAAHANGPVASIFFDEIPLPVAELQLEQKLIETLKNI